MPKVIKDNWTAKTKVDKKGQGHIKFTHSSGVAFSVPLKMFLDGSSSISRTLQKPGMPRLTHFERHDVLGFDEFNTSLNFKSLQTGSAIIGIDSELYSLMMSPEFAVLLVEFTKELGLNEGKR